MVTIMCQDCNAAIVGTIPRGCDKCGTEPLCGMCFSFHFVHQDDRDGEDAMFGDGYHDPELPR